MGFGQQTDEIQNKINRVLQKLDNLPAGSYMSQRPKEEPIYNRALEELIDIGNSGITYLMPLLQNHPEAIREIAAEVLGKLKVKESIPLLLKAAKYEKNFYVQIKVCKALGEINHKEIVPELISIFESDIDEYLRRAIAHTIATIDKEKSANFFIKNIKKYPEIRFIAINFFCDFRVNEAIPILAEAIHDPIYNFTISAKVQPSGLVDQLNNRNSRFILESLCKFGTQEAKATIIKASQEKDIDVRIDALIALSKIESQETVNILKSALRDKELAVRVRTIAILTKLGVIKSPNLEELFHAAYHQDLYTRQNAILALGEIGDVQALPILYPLQEEKLLGNFAYFAVLNIRKHALSPPSGKKITPISTNLCISNVLYPKGEFVKQVTITINNKSREKVKGLEVQFFFAKNYCYVASIPQPQDTLEIINKSMKWTIPDLLPKTTCELRVNLKTISSGPAYHSVIVFHQGYIIDTFFREVYHSNVEAAGD